jgi:deoxycytidine triphosphate deaminase
MSTTRDTYITSVLITEAVDCGWPHHHRATALYVSNPFPARLKIGMLCYRPGLIDVVRASIKE